LSYISPNGKPVFGINLIYQSAGFVSVDLLFGLFVFQVEAFELLVSLPRGNTSCGEPFLDIANVVLQFALIGAM
jgi:hypothetical protein